MSSWSSTEEGISVFFVIFSFLLAAVLLLSKLLRDHAVLASVLPEAGMILLVGMVAGAFSNWIAPSAPINYDDAEEQDVIHSLVSFSPNVFFIALLPPIIFNSGYHLRRELFFRHFTPISLFACVGTLVSAFSIAVILKIVVAFELTGGFHPTLTELLTFGALISATDPVSTLAVLQSKRVDPQLFYLVFGESVLNDAVGLVLFNAFARFVVRDNGVIKVATGILEFLLDFSLDFVGSSLLGFLCGMFAGLLLKRVDMRTTPLLELCLYIMIMYVPYLVAEILRLSGIVTILFTGLAARRYCVPNLSKTTAANADVFFRLASHLAETSIFLELGLSVFALATGNFQWRFILWSLLACLVGRALNVYPITLIYNRALRRPLTSTQHDHNDDCDNHVHADLGHVEMTEVTKENGGSLNSSHTMTPSNVRDLKIPSKTAHMLWFSGLRGAVAYACVKEFPDTFGHQTFFVVTTMSIVLVTVFVLGGTTEIMLSVLNIDMGVDEEKYMEDCSRESVLSGFLQRFEQRYVWKCIIRRDSQTIESADGSCMSLSSLVATDDVGYQQHIEVSASQHFDNVQRMNHKESLYDYGSH